MFESVGSFVCICFLFVLTTLIGIFYQCIFRFWFYFTDHNVKFVRGIPLLGSNYKSILGIEPAAISYRRLYERFPLEKFIGIYDFCGRPSFLIRDPDLVKQVLITDVDFFAKPGLESDLFAHNTLIGVKGSKWYETRFSISPVFYGNRMRSLHSLMVESSEKFIQAVKETNKIAKLFDSRDLFTRYAIDIIAKTALGMEMNSMRDMDNAFFTACSSLNELRYTDDLKLLASLSFPSFVDILSNGDENVDYLRKIVNESVQAKKGRDDSRFDMIELLMKLRSGQSFYEMEDKVNIGYAAEQDVAINKTEENIQNCSDDDVVSQLVIFLLSGLNSVSTTSSFMFHELAINPDIQNKLFMEIETVKKELNGAPFSYEMIPKMKYLDMVVCETLRRWCPVPFLERTCSRPYSLANQNGSKVELQIGDGVFIPTYALHMEHKYFPNPMKFDPERFSNENKDFIKAGTYLPFGMGQRNCIGTRFALIAIKTLAFNLLSEFYIDKSYKTQDPLKLKALPLHMDAENGFHIELRRRQPDRTPYKSQVFT